MSNIHQVRAITHVHTFLDIRHCNVYFYHGSDKKGPGGHDFLQYIVAHFHHRQSRSTTLSLPRHSVKKWFQQFRPGSKPGEHVKKVSISYGVKSDIGSVRRENQDCQGKFPADGSDVTMPRGLLFVVADGMGGHRGGKEASHLAVKSVEQFYFSDDGKSIPNLLEGAFQDANEKIFAYSVANPEFRGMGTTCTAMVFQDSRAHIAHIGDSRAYHIAGEAITQLTEDHSKVAEMLRRGILTPMEAKTHPERSMLYRALGVSGLAEVDVIENVQVHAGDSFLICTDGLVNHVPDDEIRAVVVAHKPQEACDALVAIANERGGYDNITVQIIHIDAA